MNEESNVQSILDALAGMAARKEVIGPERYMDAAVKIDALLQNEEEQLVELENELAKIEHEYVGTSTKAKTYLKTLDVWKGYRKKQILIKRAESFILSAKKNAQLASDRMRHLLD